MDDEDTSSSSSVVWLVEDEGRVTPLVTGDEVVGGLEVGVTGSSSAGVVVTGARVGPTAVVP